MHISLIFQSVGSNMRLQWAHKDKPTHTHRARFQFVSSNDPGKATTWGGTQ